MKIIEPGHKYTLANMENGEQGLSFIQKEPTPNGDHLLETISDGTTNEEVLRVMIDRMIFLQTKAPCRENAIVITKLEESLMWLEKRTQDRKARGVEGTLNK